MENSEGLVFGSDKVEVTLVQEGKYEVEIIKLEEKLSQKGNKYLNVVFKIRDGVGQDFGGKWLWYTIFGSQDQGQKCTYDFNAINSLIITQEGTPNYKTHFKNFDEVLLYLKGLHMTATVLTITDNNGVQKNTLDKKGFGRSEWDAAHPVNGDLKPVGDPSEGVQGKNLESVDITDDDLPF